MQSSPKFTAVAANSHQRIVNSANIYEVVSELASLFNGRRIYSAVLIDESLSKLHPPNFMTLCAVKSWPRGLLGILIRALMNPDRRMHMSGAFLNLPLFPSHHRMQKSSEHEVLWHEKRSLKQAQSFWLRYQPWEPNQSGARNISKLFDLQLCCLLNWYISSIAFLVRLSEIQPAVPSSRTSEVQGSSDDLL
jgi:hypothetical protein